MRLPSRLADGVLFRALEGPRRGRTVRDHARGLVARIETEPRPRILLGHDLGGSVALEVAQIAPEALDGLILHAPRGAEPRQPLWRFLVRDRVVASDWLASLRPVSLPAALLWGEKDRVLAVRQVEAFRPLLPGALVSLPGRWGHSPMLDDPAAYAREIAALARKLLSG